MTKTAKSKTKVKAKNAAPTEAQLKDRVWQAIQKTLDDFDVGESDNTLYDDIHRFYETKTAQVNGFVIPLADLAKIINEVEDSCLSDRGKKAILAALK